MPALPDVTIYVEASGGTALQTAPHKRVAGGRRVSRERYGISYRHGDTPPLPRGEVGLARDN